MKAAGVISPAGVAAWQSRLIYIVIKCLVWAEPGGGPTSFNKFLSLSVARGFEV